MTLIFLHVYFLHAFIYIFTYVHTNTQISYINLSFTWEIMLSFHFYFMSNVSYYFDEWTTDVRIDMSVATVSTIEE